MHSLCIHVIQGYVTLYRSKVGLYRDYRDLKLQV